jgi:hypothetical protein
MTDKADNQQFSDQLEAWLKGSQPKTLGSLIKLFGEKSFAVIILLLMFLPALPIPTGGITHVFEVVTVLIAAEQVIGMKSIWLPKYLNDRVKLGAILKGKAGQVLIGRLRWFEKHSSERWTWLFHAPGAERIFGLVIIGFTVAAALAPPFSGLDTLPALGVVLLCLALIVEDALLALIGFIIGLAGVFLSIFLGATIVHFVKHHILHKS